MLTTKKYSVLNKPEFSYRPTLRHFYRGRPLRADHLLRSRNYRPAAAVREDDMRRDQHADRRADAATTRDRRRHCAEPAAGDVLAAEIPQRV